MDLAILFCLVLSLLESFELDSSVGRLIADFLFLHLPFWIRKSELSSGVAREEICLAPVRCPWRALTPSMIILKGRNIYRGQYSVICKINWKSNWIPTCNNYKKTSFVHQIENFFCRNYHQLSSLSDSWINLSLLIEFDSYDL